MLMRAVSRILVLLTWAFAGPAGAATVTVFEVMFDPANGTTQASITGGGYATPYGTALYSGGSDDWVPLATMGRSLGTYFQVPGFQPEYDPDIARLGDVGSSVTLGNDPKISHLTNARDIIFTRWDPLYGLENVEGPNMEPIKDLAIFEKAPARRTRSGCTMRRPAHGRPGTTRFSTKPTLLSSPRPPNTIYLPWGLALAR